MRYTILMCSREQPGGPDREMSERNDKAHPETEAPVGHAAARNA